MATLSFSAFGTTWREVLGLLGGDAFHASDVAKRTAVVGSGSTTSAIVVANTVGFTVGDKININTGDFPAEGETVVISAITDAVAGGDAGTLTLDEDEGLLSVAPSSGDVVNDGPEVVERILEHLEGYVESRLPARYARMLRVVEGEVLSNYAIDGPTEFTLALATADASGAGTQYANRTNGTVFLWLSLTGRWTDRWGAEMDDSEYSVDGQTVTLDVPLSDASRLITQYEYAMTAAAAPACLGRIIRKLAAKEAASIIGLDQEPTRGQYIADLRDEAEEEMDRISDGKQTVPEFDAIQLYEDTRRMPGVSMGRLERC